MEITIDGKSDLLDLDEDTDFSDAIQQINDYVKEYGYVLETFELDGQEAWSNWRDQIGEKPISEFEQLDVEVMAPREICVETLEELKPHFEDLSESLSEVSENLQKGNKGEGFEKLNYVLSHLQQYINTISYIVNITGIDLEKAEINQKELVEYVHDLRGITNRAEGAVKDEDIVSLSDMTGYELEPAVNDWIQACDKMKELIREKWPEPESLEPV